MPRKPRRDPSGEIPEWNLTHDTPKRNPAEGFHDYLQSLPRSHLAEEFKSIEQGFLDAAGDDPEMRAAMMREIVAEQHGAALAIIAEIAENMYQAREKSIARQKDVGRSDFSYIELLADVRDLQSLADDFRESSELRDHPALQSALADYLAELFRSLRSFCDMCGDHDIPSDPGAERLTCRQFVSALDAVASYAIRHIKSSVDDSGKLQRRRGRIAVYNPKSDQHVAEVMGQVRDIKTVAQRLRITTGEVTRALDRHRHRKE